MGSQLKQQYLEISTVKQKIGHWQKNTLHLGAFKVQRYACRTIPTHLLGVRLGRWWRNNKPNRLKHKSSDFFSPLGSTHSLKEYPCLHVDLLSKVSDMLRHPPQICSYTPATCYWIEERSRYVLSLCILRERWAKRSLAKQIWTVTQQKTKWISFICPAASGF